MVNETVVEATSNVIPYLGATVPITGSPTMDIYFITVFVALFSAIVRKYFTDQIQIKALKKEMKDLQKQMKKTMAKNPQKAQTLQKEIFKKNMEQMKHNFAPKMMLTTMLPIFLVFIFVRSYYTVFGEFFNVFGLTTYTWLGTYIVFSLINSIILNKVLDVA